MNEPAFPLMSETGFTPRSLATNPLKSEAMSSASQLNLSGISDYAFRVGRTNSNFLHFFLIQRESPLCEDGGESKVLRSRTNSARNPLRTTPVKAKESMESPI